MKKWLWRLALLAVVAALGIWGWRVLFPGPEKVIRGRLDNLARAASISRNETPLARLYHAQKLGSFFTPDVEVAVNTRDFADTISGRDQLIEHAAGARSMVGSLTVELVDVQVTLGSDKQSALVDLTARLNMLGERAPQPQELKVHFKKVDGQWLIDRAETVRPLR